jgi:hypothetical protein
MVNGRNSPGKTGTVRERTVKTSYSIRLTLLESLYLSDSLSMFTQGPPEVLSESASLQDLLLKVGAAVLETDRTKEPVDVALALDELWIVREVAKSSVVVGSERVGLNLVIKVYEGLRHLAAAADVDSVVGALGEVSRNEPDRREYEAKLRALSGKEDPESGGRSDDETDSGSSDGHRPVGADKGRPSNDPKTKA